MRSSAEKAALRNLATEAGVHVFYEDVFGRKHDASDEALAGVLSAMRFDVSSEEAIARSRAGYAAEILERGLEPVCVFTSPGPFDVSLTLLKRRPVAALEWSLLAEDGTTRSGSVEPALAELEDVAQMPAGTYERYTLAITADLAEGYYELSVHDGRQTYTSHVIVAPRACYVPEMMERQRLWGIAAHVYALRSQRTHLAGDFTDLATFCTIVRDAGGSAVAVNPLHLLPRGASSPYGPSSRTFVNWVYLDIATLPGHDVEAAGADPSVAEREPLRDAEADLVDYEALYRERYAGARRAFDRFREAAAYVESRAFATYREEGAERLRTAATFEALAEKFRTYAGADDWRAWPIEFRHPDAKAVTAFAAEHEDDIAFYSYLQWQCDVQLERVAHACADMPIGLYRDLAVGTQLGGVDTWLGNGSLVHDAATGAPPDLMNPGQDWGVAPFDPLALRYDGYRPFADMLRANARHAGALRIDHVMGLLRLWWVPRGSSASDGAYVSYRLDEMLAVLALESHRAKCLIVGEDLGTVPPGLRERLEEARVLSYRVLQFEHHETGFVAPEAYPKYALASTGTHDLPTMTGYWTSADITLRERYANAATRSDATSAERGARDEQRAALRAAFAEAGVALDDESAIGLAANLFLAQAPSLLLMLTLEDVLGLTEQLNLPASTGDYPNWRHRSPVLLDDLARDPRFLALTDALRSAGRAAD